MTTPSRLRLTSITTAKADRFVSTAARRAQLYCQRINGFHLVKYSSKSCWRYRYIDAAGVRRQITIGAYPTMLPQEAASIAADWRTRNVDPRLEKAQSVEAQAETNEQSHQKTLKYYLDGLYARTLATFGERKANHYRADILYFFKAFLARDMSTLTRRDLNDWQAMMEKRPKRRNAPGKPAYYDHETIHRCYALLRALLNQAVRDEVIPVNPILGHALKPPIFTKALEEKESRLGSQRRMLTPKEMQRLLTGLEALSESRRVERRNSRAHGKPHLPDLDRVVFPHWFVPFCYLSISTGWRPGDIYALRWDHVDLRFSGKLRKYTEKSKAVARRRGKPGTLMEVPLTQTAKQVLMQWKLEQGNPDVGLVFQSPITGRTMSSDAHLLPWRRVKELGGLPKELHYYALRHHAISTMVAGGIPMFSVAKIIGHRSVELIEKHYGHLCPDSALTAMNIIEATIGQTNLAGATGSNVTG